MHANKNAVKRIKLIMLIFKNRIYTLEGNERLKWRKEEEKRKSK